MKDFKKIIKEYQEVVKHQWGQNKEALFNQIVNVFNSRDLKKIAVLTYKKYSAKGLLKFFNEKGLECEMVGKGPGGLRMIAVKKTGELSKINTDKLITFEFDNKEYTVNVGGSIFSRDGLDKGTEFLLKTVLNEKVDLNSKKIGDFGVGWGAIPLVLLTEFLTAKFVVYEKDGSSLDAASDNLKKFENIEYRKVDFIENKLEENNLDYVICNPPFHINKQEIDLLFQNIKSVLSKNGQVYFVVEKTYLKNFEEVAKQYLNFIKEFKGEDFTVFCMSC